MYQVSDMSTSALTKFQKMLGAHIIELNDEINRKQKRLDEKVGRQEADDATIAALEQNIANSQALVDIAIANNGDAQAIANGQATIVALQTELQGHAHGAAYLQPYEAAMQQLEIDSLAAERDLCNTKLTEVNTALGQ